MSRHALVLTLLLAAASAFSQSKPPAGHWEGALQLPDRELKFVLDLAQNDKGEWVGDADFPDQKTQDLPLSKIEVKEKSVSFAITGPPGDPFFKADLSEDGKVLKGELSQGGGSFQFELKWISEPKVAVPEKSTPISKEAVGTWEGALTTPNGQQLRLRVKLSNGPDGLGTGTLDSIDQGAKDLPLSGIIQEGAKLKFKLRMVGGSYEGEVNGDELAGNWSQGGGTLPLTLKRVAEPAK